MTQVSVLEARRDTCGGYKVDVGCGERIGRVSSEWFSRPADERYLPLSELARTVRDRADRSRTRVVESALIPVEANRNDPERLVLILPGTDTPIALTHWSFGQLASLIGALAAYLRQLPAPLAAEHSYTETYPAPSASRPIYSGFFSRSAASTPSPRAKRSTTSMLAL